MFWATGGVAYGRPLSGSLWVMAMDPILRHLHRDIIASGKGDARQCADDVGALLRRFEHLLSERPVVDAVERLAALRSQIAKTLRATL
eukprot:9479512-Pyramimonas_sp.AAC.1